MYFNQNGYVYDDLESECSGLIHGRSWSSCGRVSAQAQSLTVGVAGSSVVVGLHCSRQERNSVDACSSMELEKLKLAGSACLLYRLEGEPGQVAG